MDVDAGSLAELATTVWRLRNKIADHPHKRHVRAVFEAMRVFGLEVHDFDDAAFDPEQGLRVLAVQPTADLDHQTVLETVRPAVYLRGILVQRGEVIVGMPRRAPQETP